MGSPCLPTLPPACRRRSLACRLARLEQGISDEFVVLATRRANSGPGFGGSSGGIGVAEVAGTVTFNPTTLLHDVTWRPLVRALSLCIALHSLVALGATRALCLCTRAACVPCEAPCVLCPHPPSGASDLRCIRREREAVDGLAGVHAHLRQSLRVCGPQCRHFRGRVGCCRPWSAVWSRWLLLPIRDHSTGLAW
jgi:hypothetical protein